ncbi:hypothetical protein [Actinomadura fibrosa]|uniref:Uncharacterized protein n=1 Tax=Actinomadura fibrosa TaxID=111802 RepID=A0ABW2XP91_9ACTN|nr:hypothetical protein [Actinomadura fibrosa]
MRIEHRLRDAAREEMVRVGQEDLRPLELPRHRSRPSWRRLVPAVAVPAAVALTLVFAHLPGREANPPPLSGGDGPPYFVTLPAGAATAGAAVHDAVTGRKTAEIPARGGYAQVAAAGDRRTFFLAEDEGPRCSVRVDRVRLAGDGTVAARSAVPGRFPFDVTAGRMAVSEDGERLAFGGGVSMRSVPQIDERDCGQPNGITVVETRSGARRVWKVPPNPEYEPVENASPWWGADGRTLYFLAAFADSAVEVMALDTRAGGSDLATAADVVFPARWGEMKATGLLHATPDGRTFTVVVCDRRERCGVEDVAAFTGRRVRRVAALPPADWTLVSPDATGRHMIALIAPGEDERIIAGRIDDGYFRRLKDYSGDAGAAAW